MPSRPSLPKLHEAAARCRACPLWERGTQTVFGAGRASSVAMFVGERPADLAEHVTATIHPSAILRQRDETSRHEEMAKFVEDLQVVASVL